MRKQPRFSYDTWQCSCGHVVHDTEFAKASEGLTCPRCGRGLVDRTFVKGWASEVKHGKES